MTSLGFRVTLIVKETKASLWSRSYKIKRGKVVRTEWRVSRVRGWKLVEGNATRARWRPTQQWRPTAQNRLLIPFKSPGVSFSSDLRPLDTAESSPHPIRLVFYTLRLIPIPGIHCYRLNCGCLFTPTHAQWGDSVFLSSNMFLIWCQDQQHDANLYIHRKFLQSWDPWKWGWIFHSRESSCRNLSRG